jgi:FtsP/CotA-like multicopper oxidase with cupredoxin domain
MDKGRFIRLMGLLGLAVMVAALPWGNDLAYGNAGPAGATFYANSPQGGASGTALRKFVDSLPGLGPTHANNLGNFIPVATKMTDPSGHGDDYYEIGEVEYTMQMHSDLPKATKLRGYKDLNPAAPANPNTSYYLGPLIISQMNKPVRVKFTNQLGIGAEGNLFIPVDTTLMGAGTGPDMTTTYTENRTAVHLHGGATPWISDGTPHQWFTPVGETAKYNTGVSLRNVPDMANPGQGSVTNYYTNQQSNRLMFYHDHAVGITRLNVYAGMAAGYLITDSQEEALINAGTIPDNGDPTGVYRYGIPLVIQDKGFVPSDVATQDSKWDTANWGVYGDLWWPHVYEPNQSLTDPSGFNQYGRWDFGPWVWPNITAPVKKAALPLPGTTADNPAGYAKSAVPESFMDTAVVNGCAYPYLDVAPTAYRFRILNAANDRYLNLQLYLDASGGGSGATATATVDVTPGSPTLGQVTAIAVTNGGSGFVRAPGINITGGGGFGAWATATVVGGVVTAITVTDGGSDYTSPPTVTVGATTEVKMVPAVPTTGFPATWPTDGRVGGVPDPATAGPMFYQIGNEGGFIPQVAVLPNQPVNYDYDRGSATVLNVLNTGGGYTLYLGPAERADVIVDFSSVPSGTNVILYNDAPAPMPGFQPRYDYYTGNPDLTSMGGAYQTLPGYGPNTRTVMQFRVSGTPTAAFDLAALQNTTTGLPAAYVATQPPPIVPETFYPGPYQAATDTFGTIFGNSLTFTPVGSTTPMTQSMVPKAIIELFDNYGRMNATLGSEVTDWTTIPARSVGYGFPYIDPPNDILTPGQAQIWKITHNGVDTHAIHFHLVNVQVINRVGWDNAIKPPDENERGWKETIRMNPLEVCWIAMKATLPTVPFGVPHSIRPLNPSMPLGSTVGFSNIDPATGNPLTTPTFNKNYDFGYEYVWHCHLLGHEENDMMRPLVVKPPTNQAPMNYLLLLQ